MKRKSIWLSYDLSFKGDYEGLYAWLDNHQAMECGNCVAFLSYEFDRDLIEEIKADLLASISLSKRDRIYAIWMNEDGKVKGSFLFGKRKASVWAGYGEITCGVQDG